MFGFGTLAIMTGIGLVTAVGSSVLTGAGKGEIAKQGTLAVELILWGAIASLLAGDAISIMQKFSALGATFGGM